MLATEMKTVLIVYAHESKESFNASAKNKAEDELKKQGFTVEVSDLYAMKFKVTATAKDIVGKTGIVQVTLCAVFFFFFFSWSCLFEFVVFLQITLSKTSSTMQMPPRKRGATGNCLKTLLMSRAN